MKTTGALREFLSRNGRKGGLKYKPTPARIAAARASLAKARTKRWPKKPAQ